MPELGNSHRAGNWVGSNDELLVMWNLAFLEDEVARLAGEGGFMHETPLLFDVGDEIEIDFHRIRVLGHARFSYWRGFLG